MDRAAIESFLERFVDIAAGATTLGLLAVADRSGLTSHLGRVGGGTAEELAEGAGLQQRYVEEILSGLTAAGVLTYDAGSGRFDLPPEHALFLADESSPYFMGGFLDMIPSALAQIDALAEATVHGGGVEFEQFGPRMLSGIDRSNTPSQKTFLTSRWLPGVPGLVPRLEEGIAVADVGCGAGTAAVIMATAYPESSVVGYDVSPEAISIAIRRGEGIPNLHFERRAVEDIPARPGFGLITCFDVIHDLPDPVAGMAAIRRALTVGGLFLMMEPNLSSRLEENIHPRGAMTYGLSALHCMTQSLAKGGAGLGAAWGRERAEELARQAGFGGFHHLEDISNRFSAFYVLEA